MPDMIPELTILGHTVMEPRKEVECFPNQQSRDYLISLTFPEFTCECPVTGQPDFATILIEYLPDQKVVESKSLKLYFWSWRNVGMFHENVVNQILTELFEQIEPLWMRVTGSFNPRGGIGIEVTAEEGSVPKK